MTNQQQLILANINLADRIAIVKSNKISCVRIDEIKSAAYLGLCDAANKYDVEKSDNFEIFAVPRIIGAIKDYLREISWGPRKKIMKQVSIEDYECNLYHEISSEFFETLTKQLSPIYKKVITDYHQHDRKLKEIAVELGVKESRVSQILHAAQDNLRRLWWKRKSELWAEVA